VLRVVDVGVPFSSEDHVPLSTIKSTSFYKTLLKPHRIGGCFGVKLWDRADGRAVFVATSPEEHLAATKLRLFPILERLAPHLSRSLALSWALRRQRAKGLEDGLSRQADAVFVVNVRGEVVFMNAAAKLAVQQGIVRVAPSTQKLGLVSRKENAAFGAMLRGSGAAAAEISAPAQRQILGLDPGDAGSSRRLMTFTSPANNGPNLLEILTLPGGEASTIQSIFHDRAREPHALVTVRRRGGLGAPSLEDIRTVFGLSQREGEVTLALVEGRSVEDFANATGVAVDTVRWHLKNIYRRTECSNQAGLVRLVLSLVGRANLV
jgi:DNA-binding CsgD family transcriptional regulator